MRELDWGAWREPLLSGATRADDDVVVAAADAASLAATIRSLHRENCVPVDLAPAERAALEKIVRQLEAAWNVMDGSAFAAPFAVDAEFVNIRGEYFRGRTAIAAGHAGLFQGIYAGSTNHCAVEGTRLLRPEVALVRVHSVLHVPQGPLAGRHSAASLWSSRKRAVAGKFPRCTTRWRHRRGPADGRQGAERSECGWKSSTS